MSIRRRRNDRRAGCLQEASGQRLPKRRRREADQRADGKREQPEREQISQPISVRQLSVNDTSDRINEKIAGGKPARLGQVDLKFRPQFRQHDVKREHAHRAEDSGEQHDAHDASAGKFFR